MIMLFIENIQKLLQSALNYVDMKDIIPVNLVNLFDDNNNLSQVNSNNNNNSNSNTSNNNNLSQVKNNTSANNNTNLKSSQEQYFS